MRNEKKNFPYDTNKQKLIIVFSPQAASYIDII